MQNERLYTKNFVLTTLSTFALFVSFYFLLVTLPLYILKLGGSESEIGLIIGVFTISAVLLRPHLGREVDRRGRKKVLIAGLLVFLLSMLLYDYTTSPASLLLLRVLHGAGWGAATTASTTLIADIAPVYRRGEAMGVFGMAANVAMAVGPLLSVLLLNASSFPTLFAVSAGIALVSLLLILPVTETIVVHPMAPLLSREALMPSALMFLVTLTYGSIVSFLPLFTRYQGIDPGTFFTVFAAKYGLLLSGSDLSAAFFFTVFAITVIIVRVVAGRLSDIKGRRSVIIPGMLLSTAGLLVLSTSGSFGIFLTAAVIYGLGFGSVHPTLIAFLVDRVSDNNRGGAMGTFTAAFDLGIGTGSILLGLVLQFAGFTIMFILAGVVVFSGTVLFIREKNQTV